MFLNEVQQIVYYTVEYSYNEDNIYRAKSADKKQKHMLMPIQLAALVG